MLYRVLLVLKLVSVLAYAGGVVGAFAPSALQDRKRAAHGIAGPSLLAVWVFGYLLAEATNVSLMELWILGGFALSTASQGVISRAVALDLRGWGAFCAAALPLLLVLVLMVFRPTWSTFRP